MPDQPPARDPEPPAVAYVRLPAPQAAYVVATLTFYGQQAPEIPNGEWPMRMSARDRVLLPFTARHLAFLASLPSNCDGYVFDGYLWIAGTEWRITDRAEDA